MLEINVEEYYNEYGPMIYRRCLFLLQNEDKAYDALQEVFISLLKKKDQIQIKSPSA